MHICTYIYIYAYIYICIYIYICAYIYIYLYTFMHLNKYTHNHKLVCRPFAYELFCRSYLFHACTYVYQVLGDVQICMCSTCLPVFMICTHTRTCNLTLQTYIYICMHASVYDLYASTKRYLSLSLPLSLSLSLDITRIPIQYVYI